MTDHKKEAQTVKQMTAQEIRELRDQYSENWCIPDVDGPLPPGAQNIFAALTSYADLLEKKEVDKHRNHLKLILMMAELEFAAEQALGHPKYTSSQYRRLSAARQDMIQFMEGTGIPTLTAQEPKKESFWDWFQNLGKK